MPTIVDTPTPPTSYFAQHQQQHQRALTRKTKKRYIGTSVRQSILQVFDGLGGWEAMLEWARDNPDVFYGSVIPRLLPTELAESGLAGKLTIIVQRGAEPLVLPSESNGQASACTQIEQAREQAEVQDSNNP